MEINPQWTVGKGNNSQVLFHNLYRGSSDTASKYGLKVETENDRDHEQAVYSRIATYLSLLNESRIIKADDELLEEAMEKQMQVLFA